MLKFAPLLILFISGLAHAQAPIGDYNLDESGENMRFAANGDVFSSAYGTLKMTPADGANYQLRFRDGTICLIQFVDRGAGRLLMRNADGNPSERCEFGMMTPVDPQ